MGGPPISRGGSPGCRAGEGVVDVPEADTSSSGGSSGRTGMSASVPESPMTDHRAVARVSALCPLEDMGVLSFQGADAVRFLQGQLSNDLAALAPGEILRAGLHNPQGRTIALLWLAAARSGTAHTGARAGADADAGDEILALLPRELAGSVLAQLRRYVLRAKVTILDQSAHWRIAGVLLDPLGGTHAASGAELPAQCWRLDARRAVLLQPADEAWPAAPRLERAQWRALDIAEGEPQVYAATSAQFVAQMLNLDCIDAISFTKGCYTGQEVIARAHYRGRVKRRMQRFETDDAVELAPGGSGRLSDGRAFRVVEAVRRAGGGSEFLAVATLPGTARDADADADAERPGAAAAPAVHARALPLPYELPE